jgi:L-fucose mutarotase/ribose pyranase (RbsD/FucU family)
MGFCDELISSHSYCPAELYTPSVAELAVPSSSAVQFAPVIVTLLPVPEYVSYTVLAGILIGTEYRLPAAVAVPRATTYTWHVTAVLPVEICNLSVDTVAFERLV